MIMLEKIRFNIVEKRKIFFIISLCIIAAGIIGFIAMGFNLDIDFIGGTTMHIDMHKAFDNQMRDDINAVVTDVMGEKASSIQKTGSSGTEVIIKTKELSTEQRDAIFEGIKEKYGLDDSDRLMVDNVSPAVGKDLSRSAFISCALAVLLMLIYITIRFEFLTGLSAVICLMHDALVMLTIYVLFRLPMGLNFIAAILTILGYSINATIIIFDRVRENMKLLRRSGFAEVINVSIWQTLTRSINTSLTTLMVIVVLYILGVPTIKDFAFPIIVGIIAGTYSSVFISGNIWYVLRKKFNSVK